MVISLFNKKNLKQVPAYSAYDRSTYSIDTKQIVLTIVLNESLSRLQCKWNSVRNQKNVLFCTFFEHTVW